MNQTSDKKWIKAKIIILIKMLFKKEIARMDILTNAKYIEKYYYFSMDSLVKMTNFYIYK